MAGGDHGSPPVQGERGGGTKMCGGGGTVGDRLLRGRIGGPYLDDGCKGLGAGEGGKKVDLDDRKEEGAYTMVYIKSLVKKNGETRSSPTDHEKGGTSYTIGLGTNTTSNVHNLLACFSYHEIRNPLGIEANHSRDAAASNLGSNQSKFLMAGTSDGNATMDMEIKKGTRDDVGMVVDTFDVFMECVNENGMAQSSVLQSLSVQVGKEGDTIMTEPTNTLEGR